MAEPVERFDFMKATVRTQVQVEDDPVRGKITLCFIDVITPDGFPDISIGWGPRWERFGVYVDGDEVFPPADESSNIPATDDDADAEGLAQPDEGTTGA